MRLKDYHCSGLGFRTSIPLKPGTWSRLLRTLGRARLATNVKIGQETVGIAVAIQSPDEHADYHFHLFAGRAPLKKKPKKLDLHLDLHPNAARALGKDTASYHQIPELESWLCSLIGREYRNRELELKWEASFEFDAKIFNPVFPMPFRVSTEIGKDMGGLGAVSISGLKITASNSSAGLRSVFISSKMNGILVRTLFVQRAVLGSGLADRFLTTASSIATLFIKKVQQ